MESFEQIDFVAHSIRDYLRGVISIDDLSHLDAIMSAGETCVAVLDMVDLVVTNEIPLRRVCVANLTALYWLNFEHSSLNDLVYLIPRIRVTS